MSKTAIPLRAWIDLLLLALIWGAIFLVIEFALLSLTPLWAVFHRVVWAALLLWLIALWRGYRPPTAPAAWGAFLVMGLLNNVIPFSLITWGQTEIESGLASILNATTGFFGVIVAAVLLADEKLTAARLIGAICGFLGVAVIMGVEALSQLDPRALGQIAVLGAALSYAFAGAWARRTMAGHAPIVSAAGMLTGSSLIMAPLAWTMEGAPPADLNLTALSAIAYMSILGTACAYLLYYRILAAAGSGNLMLVTVVMPPISLLLGWAVLGETFGVNEFAGCALILLGLAIMDGRILRKRTSRAQTP